MQNSDSVPEARLEQLPEIETGEPVEESSSEVIADRGSWMALRSRWNALAAASPFDWPMVRHEFLTIFLDNFAPEVRLRVVVVRREETLAAGAALASRRCSYHGLPYSALTSLSNVHSGRFDLLALDDDAVRGLWRQIRALPGWDVIELRDVPYGGRAEQLVALAARDGFLTGRWESMRTPFVDLKDGPPPSAKLRQNLRSRRRRLEEVGPVRVEELEGGAIDAFLERGFALEAAGWKGREGTAIAKDPATRGFYRELAHEAARLGWLSLWGLSAGDRLVAFQFGLRAGGRQYLPKPAYDEGLGFCSPGQLLMEEVLESCRRRGLAEFDFLGPSMAWKRDWTPYDRVHAWHFIHRPTLTGRALWSLRFWVAPTVHRWTQALGGE